VFGCHRRILPAVQAPALQTILQKIEPGPFFLFPCSFAPDLFGPFLFLDLLEKKPRCLVSSGVSG